MTRFDPADGGQQSILENMGGVEQIDPSLLKGGPIKSGLDQAQEASKPAFRISGFSEIT